MSFVLSAWLAVAGAAEPPPAPATTDPPVASRVQVVLADEIAADVARSSAAPRLYNFWATWCGPCVAELPLLGRFAAAHPELEVVLIDLDHSTVPDARIVAFLEQHDAPTGRWLRLGDADPVTALPAAMEGWPNAIPVTVVVRPGAPAVVLSGAVDEALLTKVSSGP